ncbi:MAG TPA: HEAT repeat domain-containing protein [Phycisphaerae bacterium]|nr:HEAT repeat domain-containing protein [Phycisphaerae bacterium]
MVAQNKGRLGALAALVLCVSVCGLVAQAAPAPAAGEKTREEKLADLWENLIHFIRIGQEEAAPSFAQSLLSAGAKPVELYRLSVETPGSLAALARGGSLKGMKDLVPQLLKLIEEGYRAVRSDPEQIKESIELLGGTQRAYLRGRDRLVVSGEYAVPQLLRKLEDPDTTNVLREKIMVVLPMLGKDAVLPLVAATQTPDPQLRQIIANALGRVEYPHAVPRLKELYDRKDLQPATRRIVRAALVACAGGDTNVIEKPVAQLYYELALRFYYRAESLVPDERSEQANIWYWDKDLAGLTFKPVPRQIFCDIYALRMARLTLVHDPKFYPAVSLWLAADLKREIDLPEGAADPTRTPTEPSAEFYVLSAGAKYQQDILARALHDRDWPVAVRTIEALGATSGAESLVDPVAGGAQPLVEALSCSNRLVRYWAAASLATALPKKRYTGYELVMPILAGAMRQTGMKTAVVVAAEQERRNLLMAAARAAGYEVIDANDAATGLTAARAKGGADVAILAGAPDPMAGVGVVRRDPLLATLPIVVTAQTERFQALAKSDPRVRLVSPDVKDAELGEAIAEVVQTSAGAPLTPEEATQWAVRAAEAVRGVGLTQNTVYDVTRCRAALVEAIDDPRPEVKVAAAGALATMAGPRAQRAIAKLALGSADDKIRVEAFGALTESVRKYGNSLADDQAQAVVDIVAKGSGEVRMAAAQLLGALSLPSEMVKQLIVEHGGKEL